VSGQERQDYYTPGKRRIKQHSKMALSIGSRKSDAFASGSKRTNLPTLYRYWQTGYTIVLAAYRRLQESTRESVQFREF